MKEGFGINVVSHAFPKLAKGNVLMKIDAYTYLRLNSGNDYGIKASMYSSKDFLEDGKEKDPKAGKLKGFLVPKKKEPGDWRCAEWE